MAYSWSKWKNPVRVVLYPDITGSIDSARQWIPFVRVNLLPRLHNVHGELKQYSFAPISLPDGAVARVSSCFGHDCIEIWAAPVTPTTGTKLYFGFNGNLYTIDRNGNFTNIYSNDPSIIGGQNNEAATGVPNTYGPTKTVTDAVTAPNGNWIASISTTISSLDQNGNLQTPTTASLISGTAPGLSFDLPDCLQMRLCVYNDIIVAIGASLTQNQVYLYGSTNNGESFELLATLDMPFSPNLSSDSGGATVTGIAVYNEVLCFGVYSTAQTGEAESWIIRTSDFSFFDWIPLPAVDLYDQGPVALTPTDFIIFNSNLYLGYNGELWLTPQNIIESTIDPASLSTVISNVCLFNGSLYGIGTAQVSVPTGGNFTRKSILVSSDGSNWDDAGFPGTILQTYNPTEPFAPAGSDYMTDFLGLGTAGNSLYLITTQTFIGSPFDNMYAQGQGPVDIVVYSFSTKNDLSEVFRQNITQSQFMETTDYILPDLWFYFVAPLIEPPPIEGL